MDIEKGNDFKKCDNTASLITLDDFVEGNTDEEKQKNYKKFMNELIYVDKPFGKDNKRHCSTVTELYKLIMTFQIRKHVRENVNGDIDVIFRIRNPITGNNFTTADVKFIKAKAVQLGIDKELEAELNETRQREQKEYEDEMGQFEQEALEEEEKHEYEEEPISLLQYNDTPYYESTATTLDEFLEEQHDVLIVSLLDIGYDDDMLHPMTLLFKELRDDYLYSNRNNEYYDTLFLGLQEKYYNNEGIRSLNNIRLFNIIMLLEPRFTKEAIELVHKIVFKCEYVNKWNSFDDFSRLLFYHLFTEILALDGDAIDFEYISSKKLLQQLFENRGDIMGFNSFLELDLEQQKFKSFCILHNNIFNNGTYDFGLETAYTGQPHMYSDDSYMLLLYGSKHIDRFVDDIMKGLYSRKLIIGVNIIEDILDNNLLNSTKNYWESNGYNTTINNNWAIKVYENKDYGGYGDIKQKVVYRKKTKSSKMKRKSSKKKIKSSKNKRKSSKRKIK
jgi:hypothetical protein